jgi:hypothetical protein
MEYGHTLMSEARFDRATREPASRFSDTSFTGPANGGPTMAR